MNSSSGTWGDAAEYRAADGIRTFSHPFSPATALRRLSYALEKVERRRHRSHLGRQILNNLSAVSSIDSPSGAPGTPRPDNIF